MPNRLIELLWPNGSRRFCPEGVGDQSAANCRYCLAVKGMTCACCPLLCEMQLHHDPEIDQPTIDFKTEEMAVRARAAKEFLRALRGLRRPGTRNRKAWLRGARIAPAFDHRILALVAVAVLPGFWVWPLRGHIKAATVSLFSLVRRTNHGRKSPRHGR